MKKRILCKIVLGLLIMAAPFAYSQNVSFNSTSNPPNSSAVLDMSGCTNGGFMLPWMTLAQMNSISSPITSLLVLDDSTNCYYAYFAGATPKWVKCYCLCNGGPGTPGAISSTTTTPATGANETFSVTAVTGATSYTWTLPTGATITTGSLTNTITAIMGCSSGNVSVTANNSCGTSAARTLAITGSGAAPATPGAISGITDFCSGTTNISYSVAAVSGASSYTWTVPAGCTITGGSTTNSILITGGSTAGNITVKANDACGSSAASTLAVTAPSGAPATPTVSGTTPISKNSTGNTFTATSAGATSFTWTVPAAVGTITAGQGTGTITVTAAGGAGSGTITATATNACGTSAAGTELVTVSACVHGGTIIRDPNAASKNKSGVNALTSNSLSITTSNTNDLVIVACDGFNAPGTPNFTGSVDITGAWTGSATLYNKIATTYSEIAIFWFLAPSAGTYTITINETGYIENDNFAVALTGFNCTPDASDIIANATNSTTCAGCQTLAAKLVVTANSYAIGAYCNFWEASPAPAWVNAGALTSLNSDANTTGHNDYAYGGLAISTSATNTYTMKETSGNEIGDAVLFLLDVQ